MLTKTMKRELKTLEDRVGRIASILDEHKGERIVVMDLRGLCDFADAFVVVTGRSNTHMQALVHHVMERMKAEGLRPINQPEEPAARWMLIDYADVVVHVFDAETRAYYNLEGLWGDAARLEWQGLATA